LPAPVFVCPRAHPKAKGHLPPPGSSIPSRSHPSLLGWSSSSPQRTAKVSARLDQSKQSGGIPLLYPGGKGRDSPKVWAGRKGWMPSKQQPK
jgi:hypothetical protein